MGSTFTLVLPRRSQTQSEHEPDAEQLDAAGYTTGGSGEGYPGVDTLITGGPDERLGRRPAPKEPQ